MKHNNYWKNLAVFAVIHFLYGSYRNFPKKSSLVSLSSWVKMPPVAKSPCNIDFHISKAPLDLSQAHSVQIAPVAGYHTSSKPVSAPKKDHKAPKNQIKANPNRNWRTNTRAKACRNLSRNRFLNQSQSQHQSPSQKPEPKPDTARKSWKNRSLRRTSLKENPRFDKKPERKELEKPWMESFRVF